MQIDLIKAVVQAGWGVSDLTTFLANFCERGETTTATSKCGTVLHVDGDGNLHIIFNNFRPGVWVYTRQFIHVKMLPGSGRAAVARRSRAAVSIALGGGSAQCCNG